MFGLPPGAEAVFYPDNGIIKKSGVSYTYGEGSMIAFRYNNAIYGGFRDDSTYLGKAILMGYAPMSPTNAQRAGDFINPWTPVNDQMVYAARRTQSCEGEFLKGDLSGYNTFNKSITDPEKRKIKPTNISHFQTIGASSGYYSTICGCQDSYSDVERDLLNKYRKLGLLSVRDFDDPITRVLCRNPLLLQNQIINLPDYFYSPESEWIAGLKNVVAGMTAIGFTPVILEIMIPAVMEVIVAAGTETATGVIISQYGQKIVISELKKKLSEGAKDFAKDFTIDVLVQAFFIWIVPDEGQIVNSYLDAFKYVDYKEAALTSIIQIVNPIESGEKFTSKMFFDEFKNCFGGKLIGEIIDLATSGKPDDPLKDAAECFGNTCISNILKFGAFPISKNVINRLSKIPRPRIIRLVIKFFGNGSSYFITKASFLDSDAAAYFISRFVLKKPFEAGDVIEYLNISNSELIGKVTEALNNADKPDFIKYVFENGFFAHLRNETASGYSLDVREKLVKDLLESADLAREIFTTKDKKGNLVGRGLSEIKLMFDAWGIVNKIGTNEAWRRSTPFLEKVSDIVYKSNLQNVIKGSGSGTLEEEFSKILSGLQANPCKICNATSFNVTLRPIEEILDNIKFVANNLPNFQINNIISQFKVPHSPSSIGLKRGWAFELRQVAIKNNPNAVYGQQITNAQHGSKFDMKVGNKYEEFKSTESITGDLYNPANTNGNSINQLLDYFGGINKADDLAITFDSKALVMGVSAVDEMKTVMGNLKTQIFPRMSTSLRNDIFNNTGIEIASASDIDATVINYLTNTIVKIY